MKAIWILLFFTMVLMMSGPVPVAFALKCAPPPSPKEEMSYSKFVFKGRLVTGQDNKLKFEVTKVWKGQAGRSITLASNYWTEFKEGADSCSRVLILMLIRTVVSSVRTCVEIQDWPLPSMMFCWGRASP